MPHVPEIMLCIHEIFFHFPLPGNIKKTMLFRVGLVTRSAQGHISGCDVCLSKAKTEKQKDVSSMHFLFLSVAPCMMQVI